MHTLCLLLFAWSVTAWQYVLQQPEAAEPPSTRPHRALDWGELNVIATTDTHGWLRGHLGHSAPEDTASGDWGDLLSFVTHMKHRAHQKGVDLLVCDSGDTVDGNGLVDADPGVKGSAARQLFLNMPYDLLTLGNHELYNYTVALDIHTNFVPRWQGRYLASNVDIEINGTFVPFGSRFRRWTSTRGTRIFSLGVMFDFKLPAAGLRVQKLRQLVEERWLADELQREEGIDAFVLVGHMPTYDPGWRLLLRHIRTYHPDTPVVMLGGHAHIRACTLPETERPSLLMASGRYMETVGFLGVNMSGTPSFSRRYLDQNRLTYMHHSNITDDAAFDTPAGLAVTKTLSSLAESMELSRVLGYAPQSYYLNRYPYTHPASLAHLLTSEIFPRMIRNETRPAPPLMIVNTGSTRFDISQGAFTIDSQYLVLPFLNRNVFIRDVPQAIASILVSNLHGEPGDENLRSSGYTHREAAAASYGLSLTDPSMSLEKFSYGYVTLDGCEAAGGPGDDIRHRPLPAYPLPEYVATALPDGELVDVAFFDFIGPVVIRTLNRLQSDRIYTASDIDSYSSMSSDIILGEYARRFWSVSTA